MEDKYKNSILLIGPPSVGKANISLILSEKTNLQNISLADSRDKYYSELNYDYNYANKLKQTEGVIARYKYWKKFEAHHISSILPTIEKEAIIKFEASQTVYEDPELFSKVADNIRKYENIILILPDVDMKESWKTVDKIGKIPANSDLSRLNKHLVESPCNTNLATFIAYVNGRSCEEIADEILEYIEKKRSLCR